MGLFKEFKDDFSQAVNELVPGDVPEKEVEPKAQTADNLVVDTIGENVDVASELSKLDGLLEHVEEQPQETTVPRPTPSENFAEHTINTQKEEQIPQMNDIPQPVNTQPVNNNVLSGDVQDETSVITASTVLTGDLQSSGSFDIQGTINGNVTMKRYKNRQYHASTGSPKSSASTMPTQRNGPNAKWSFLSALRAASRYMP